MPHPDDSHELCQHLLEDEWQERMISMAGALGNAADVSGARGFLNDFAVDAGRIHRRLAHITVPEAGDTRDALAPVPVPDPVVAHVPVHRPLPLMRLLLWYLFRHLLPHLSLLPHPLLLFLLLLRLPLVLFPLFLAPLMLLLLLLLLHRRSLPPWMLCLHILYHLLRRM